MTAPDQALAELLCRQAVNDALCRYCRGIDRFDEATARSAFHADSRQFFADKIGSFDDFWQFAAKLMVNYASSHHQIGNILVDVNGDTAESEAYFTAYHCLLPDADGARRDYWVRGRYIDTWEHRDGLWKISYRHHVHDCRRYAPAADDGFFALSASRRGHRNRQDPVYRGR